MGKDFGHAKYVKYAKLVAEVIFDLRENRALYEVPAEFQILDSTPDKLALSSRDLAKSFIKAIGIYLNRSSNQYADALLGEILMVHSRGFMKDSERANLRRKLNRILTTFEGTAWHYEDRPSRAAHGKLILTGSPLTLESVRRQIDSTLPTGKVGAGKLAKYIPLKSDITEENKNGLVRTSAILLHRNFVDDAAFMTLAESLIDLCDHIMLRLDVIFTIFDGARDHDLANLKIQGLLKQAEEEKNSPEMFFEISMRWQEDGSFQSQWLR